MTYDELHSLINSDEDFRIERTTSTTAMDKFQEAICAFANDLPGLRKKGYLLIGVRDNGTPCGLKVDDSLMKRIAAIRSDGNILPLPTMTTEKVSTPEGDVLVVEVTPMFSTPVRYRGRTFIRIGPRRDIATLDEERILAERCTAAQETFDVMPCREATLEDLDIEMIERDYLPNAIDSDVLANASPAATFDVNLVTAFKAIVPDAEYAEAQAVTRVANVVAKELSERQRTVYEMIRDSVTKGVVLNADIIAQQLAVSSRSIQRDLNVLAAKQLIRHIGSKKTGNWEPTLE